MSLDSTSALVKGGNEALLFTSKLVGDGNEALPPI